MRDWSAFVLIFVIGVMASTFLIALQIDRQHEIQMKETRRILRLLGE